MSHPLDAIALDGTAGQAYASHRARADGIARFFAETRKLRDVRAEQAGEDNVTTLIAHFHMLTLEPGFAAPGDEPSAIAAPAALRRLNRGNGLVGTKGVTTKRDYDMALKGLVVLLYRYRSQLGPDLIDFIERDLLPPDIVGAHPPEIEVVEFSVLGIPGPETENHLLMIESSRGRRVTPFRRVQHRVNHVANGRNFLYADQADQVAGFFLSYTGLVDATGSPTRFPESLVFPGLLGALAAYRPVLLAYEIALGMHEGGLLSPVLPRQPTEAPPLSGRSGGRGGDLRRGAVVLDLGGRVLPQQRVRQRRDRSL